MQSPLLGEGRFLEREPVSHELHRFWRYVKPQCCLFPELEILNLRNFTSGCQVSPTST